MHPNLGPAASTQLPAVPNPQVIAQRMGEDMVLVHLETDQIYGLNSTAARLWELVAEGMTRDAALAALIEAYDVGPQALAEEVDAMLAEWHAAGLLLAGS